MRPRRAGDGQRGTGTASATKKEKKKKSDTDMAPPRSREASGRGHLGASRPGEGAYSAGTGMNKGE